MGEAGDTLGHHPQVSIGHGYVDLKLISDDAIYREDKVTEHVVEWVTQLDVNDSNAPSLTVIADQDGNKGVLCVAESPAADD
ncbi:hypothetical protein NF557_17140 [Ornithinimicrobium cryptoxanthini]|uniref:4a-hydroxytetrahydrobiopterin dehydratase n=1 Tax=Ornithinimicrobium cryptoxanthini TaxID=2934161 RepID=A0ABY4YJH2_9MICO|nr:hypothetical protein [Ornithinimicrobium cryptoxanthini]USQ76287.1 hypothetical protein NF557_17140 [Ornithinimicrobium cryptoxanthini]